MDYHPGAKRRPEQRITHSHLYQPQTPKGWVSEFSVTSGNLLLIQWNTIFVCIDLLQHQSPLFPWNLPTALIINYVSLCSKYYIKRWWRVGGLGSHTLKSCVWFALGGRHFGEGYSEVMVLVKRSICLFQRSRWTIVPSLCCEHDCDLCVTDTWISPCSSKLFRILRYKNSCQGLCKIVTVSDCPQPCPKPCPPGATIRFDFFFFFFFCV